MEERRPNQQQNKKLQISIAMKVRFEVEKKIRFKLVSDGDLEANADLLEALKNETGIEPPKLEDYLIQQVTNLILI